MKFENDSFRTLETASPEVVYKDRKSKFYGYVFPLNNEEEVKPIIEELRKRHHTANHVCYAWQLGVQKKRYRANDDGEPKNSAGMPIYGQIQAADLTNVLVAVARIFGGTKLGVGGLVVAYREASKLAIEASNVVERTLMVHFEVRFDYIDTDKVMRILNQHQAVIADFHSDIQCRLTFAMPLGRAETVNSWFEELPQVTISRIDEDGD